jgi:hypothetical protein
VASNESTGTTPAELRTSIREVWANAIYEFYQWSRRPNPQVIISVGAIVLLANVWLPIRTRHPEAVVIEPFLMVLFVLALEWYFKDTKK